MIFEALNDYMEKLMKKLGKKKKVLKLKFKLIMMHFERAEWEFTLVVTSTLIDWMDSFFRRVQVSESITEFVN